MRTTALVFAFLLAFGGVAIAGPAATDHMVDGLAHSDFYPVALTGKVIDGADTIVGAPLELLEHPYRDMVVKGDYMGGLFTGLYKGSIHTITTAIDGVTRVLRAPLP